MPDRPEVSVLVVNWRTKEDSLRCLEVLQSEMTGLDLEVIFVDNASGDGSMEAVRDRFGSVPGFRLIQNDTNRGFAGGNSDALAVATGRFIVVLNPDVALTRSALEAMLEALTDRPDVGMVSACLVGVDGLPQPLHRRLPTLTSLFFTSTLPGAWIDHRMLARRHARRYRLVDRPRVGTAEVEQLGGALLLFERELVDGPLGGQLFDEALPILVNDVDLSRRVLDTGRRNVVLWDVPVAHRGGASLRQVSPAALRRDFQSGMNRYFDQHGGHLRAMVAKAILSLPARSAAPPSSVEQVASSGGPKLVSIVIPCFNYGNYLAEAVGSALRQTHEELEVVIVDDGSTDDTASIAQSFGGQVRYVFQENAGLSAARNTGVREARGEFVVFLDADDLIDPTFVERCIEVLDRSPTAAFAYSHLRLIPDVGQPVMRRPYSLEHLLDGNEIQATVTMRSTVARRFPFDERNRVGWEDWDMWLTLAENGWAGALVDDVLVSYRRHETNMTSRLSGLRRRRLHFYVGRRHRRLLGTRRVCALWMRLARVTFGLSWRSLARRLGVRRS